MKNVKVLGLMIVASWMLAVFPAAAQEAAPADPQSTASAPAESQSVTATSEASSLAATVPPAVETGLPDKPEEKTAAQAIEMLSQGDKVSLSELSKAQDTLTRLDYLGKIEEALAKIAAVRRTREGAGLGGLGGMLPLPSGGSGVSSADMGGGGRDEGGYSVVRVFGSNGKYSTVLKGAGKVLIAKEGDALPNGAKIESVSMSGVRVSDGSGKYTLPFADTTEFGTGMNTNSSMNAMSERP